MQSHDAKNSANFNHSGFNFSGLVDDIRLWARELGFADIGISGIALESAEAHLMQWLQNGYHGDMNYMAAHGTKRTRPDELLPGTLRVISARLPYWPSDAAPAEKVLDDPALAYISRYALGRDYHKVLRDRLQKLANRIEQAIGAFQYRVFTDSAPVMEVALAAQTKLGWRGKHTLLLNREAGSYFFLGEIYVNLPLPVSEASSAHCGTCTACLDSCPTKAFVAPYVLDARRCISYLTIEHAGSIPQALRPLMGNRIYGCDDCQLACPWNKDHHREAAHAALPDFSSRHGLDAAKLIELFSWDEETFLKRMEGSAIRRIGHERWLRNIAVALGNALGSSKSAPELLAALNSHSLHPSALVREHVEWALAQHQDLA